MDWDEPAPKPSIAVGDNLATLSVGELEVRITALQAEIERVRAEISKKKAHEDAAAAIFKS